jgi:pimeloyl-ACP methyl ester carboxylesterase
MPARDVLFLPGFMCDERLFVAQRTALEQEGLRTSVCDLTGETSVESLAAAVLEAAPDRFALVGLSMGGIVALEVLRQAGARVTHLALLNSTPRADAAGDLRRAQLDRVARGGLAAVIIEELAPRYFAPSGATPERLALVLDMAVSLGASAFSRQTRALAARRSYEGTLGAVACPTLVVGGTEDRVCPLDIQREMARAIPGARLVALEDCGHLSTIERPAEAARALLGFLTGTPRERSWTCRRGAASRRRSARAPEWTRGLEAT